MVVAGMAAVAAKVVMVAARAAAATPVAATDVILRLRPHLVRPRSQSVNPCSHPPRGRYALSA
jgi:hypothetical protein